MSAHVTKRLKHINNTYSRRCTPTTPTAPAAHADSLSCQCRSWNMCYPRNLDYMTNVHVYVSICRHVSPRGGEWGGEWGGCWMAVHSGLRGVSTLYSAQPSDLKKNVLHFCRPLTMNVSNHPSSSVCEL